LYKKRNITRELCLYSNPRLTTRASKNIYLPLLTITRADRSIISCIYVVGFGELAQGCERSLNVALFGDPGLEVRGVECRDGARARARARAGGNYWGLDLLGGE
jgi:hypothetical protein